MHHNTPCKSGFTLIELSIVLVIIGLIVGGVLVGRDLISAAVVPAQISQIEKYQQAVNTFKGKYGYLPGDIPEPYASQFGFVARGAYAGTGDGKGIMEGITSYAASANKGHCPGSGENILIWRELSDTRLIDNSFQSAVASIIPSVSSYWHQFIFS
jgi:prepilin-type N-terminal cleavage/methylation domain-containing protein